MKRFVIGLLTVALFAPSSSVFANPSQNLPQIVSEVNDSVLTEDTVLEIVKKQLDKQNASPESYEYFSQYVHNHFAKQEGYSTQGVDDLVYASKGGEVYYDLKSGSMFVAHIENQYLSPSATLKLINDYKDGELETWDGVLEALVGYFVGLKFPIIGNIIGAYGALETISDYLDAETIRAIEDAGGQSAILTYTSSYGKDTVWVPWEYYPYFEVPEFDQYTYNISYKVYK